MATRARPETADTAEKAPKATPKAEKAPKATTKKAAAKAPATNGDGDKEVRHRTPGGERGWLAREIEKLLRRAAAKNEQVTVRDLASKITNAHGEHPSSGAVAAALVRWNEQGYVELTGSRPQAFKKFTRKYADKTLEDFLNDQREAKAKERAAAKASA